MDTKSVVKLIEERRAELDTLDEVIGISSDTRKFAVARETQAERVRDAVQMFSLSNADAPREAVVGVIEKLRTTLQEQLDAIPRTEPVYSMSTKLQTEIDVCNELISLVPEETPAEAKKAAKK